MAADSYGTKNEPQFAGSGVPNDAGDLTLVAKYAADTGNRKAGTSAVRDSLAGNDVWPGLEFFETDTGLSYLYVSATSGWMAIPGQRVDGSFGFASGMSNMGKTRLSRVGDLVKFHAEIQCTSNFNTGFAIGTLPPGFRPPGEVATTGFLVSGPNPGICWVIIAANGSVRTGSYTTTTSSSQIRIEEDWTLS